MSANSVEIKIDYNDLFESSLDFLFMLDLNGDILDVNEVAVKTLGYSRNKILTMNITDFIIDEEFDQVSHSKKELIDIGRMSQYNIYKIKKKNGDFIYLESHGVPLRKYGEIYAILGIGHEDTETKNAEQLVKASETKYRNLFNQSPFHVALFDSKGNLVESNRNIFLRLSEYLNEDFTGKNFLDIIHHFKNAKELRLLFIERFASLRKGKHLESIEFSLITKKGKTIWLYWQSSTVEINNETHIQVIIQDITEKKEAEEKLKESEEKFRRITEESHLAIIILQDNVIKYANQKLAELSGYSLEEILGWKPGEFLDKAIAPDSVQLVMEQAEKKQRGDQDVLNQYPIHLKKKSGELYWVDDISKTIMYEGRPADLISLIDITDKVNAEQELKESEEKFRTITEQSFIGVIIEQGFNIKYVNHQLSTILGYSSEELLNWKLPDFYEIIHPDDVGRFKKLIGDKTKGMYNKITNFQFRLFKKTGEIIWLELFSREIMYKDEISNLAFIMDITEKRESEQKIRESEEKFRTLFNNSTSGIAYHRIIYDSRGNPINYLITDVNPQFEKILVLKKEDVINKLSNELYEVESPPYLDIYSQVAETQLPKSFEAYFQPMNKYFNVSAISPKKGEFITVFDDITERKKATESLKSERDKLQAMLDGLTSAEVGIDIIDFNHNILFQNQFLKNRFGDIVKEKCYEKYMDSTQPCTFCPMKKAVQENKVAHHELIGADNKNYELISAPLPNPDGTINKAIEIVLDITERRKAEQELIESEEKFRTITEQSFMGIIIIQGGKLKYMNKAMSKIIGYSVEEMLMWTEQDMVRMMHPDDRDVLLKRLQSNKDENLSVFSNNSFRIINKNGDVRWLEDFTSKIVYKGKPGNLISLVDVTHKKEAEQLIIEENKRLLELQELRKDIITRVSHELKTPLTSIYGSIQILLSLFEKEMSEKALNYINIGYRGCLRLKQLIDNLLDVSRLDSKKMELFYNKENIVEIIEDCTAEMNYLADKRNLSIQLDLPDELYMNIDKLRFSQVITNIISNAIKNTQPKGRIYITLTDNDDHIDIKIKDTGVGFTPEEEELLFQKFGKIERYGKDYDVDIEGVGLGLYISKEIVELHGGQILAESKGLNTGSVFTVRLFKN